MSRELAECIADEICEDRESIVDFPGVNIDWLRLATVIEDAINSYSEKGDEDGE